MAFKWPPCSASDRGRGVLIWDGARQREGLKEVGWLAHPYWGQRESRSRTGCGVGLKADQGDDGPLGVEPAGGLGESAIGVGVA